MHDLTARFARDFRGLEPHEREDVARQIHGFLGAFIKDHEETWSGLLYLDPEGLSGTAWAETLVALLNEGRIEPGSGLKGMS